MEGIDPDSLEMQYKIKLLQKRLISKTEECVEREIQIQDLTKELANCKKLLENKPQVEIDVAVKRYKHEIEKTTKQLKSVIGERNFFENQLREMTCELDKYKIDLKEKQNQYYQLKNSKVANR